MSSDREELRPDFVVSQRYRIVRKIGSGGMGAVYEAVQEGLGRRVALKVLRELYAEDQEAVARFQREAQAAASLGHPNIVAVTDFGCDNGMLFMVMERLEGAPLSQAIAQSRAFAPTRAAWVAAQVLSALAAAHRAGIVHRDMKPDNVFLTEVSGVRDVVKVLDFGVARVTDAQGNSNLTNHGAVLGTPAYMSPEQARGRAVDARSDVYATGVLLYEMLSGRQPFQASNYHALMFAILEESPPPLASLRPDLPPALVALVERAMSKDIHTRFQSADEMRGALSPWLPASSQVDAYGRTAEIPQMPLQQQPIAVSVEAGGAPSMFAPPPAPAPNANIPDTRSPRDNVAAPSRARSTPWIVATLTVCAASAAGLVAIRGRSESANNNSTTQRNTEPAPFAVAANSPDAAAISAMLEDLMDAAAMSEALSHTIMQDPARFVQMHRARRDSGAARSLDPGGSVEYMAATMHRRPVHSTLTGGAFNGADEAALRAQIERQFAGLSICTTLHEPPPRSEQEPWTTTYEVTLDSSGSATEVRRTSAEPRQHFIVDMCVGGLLKSVHPLVRGPRVPPSMTLVFTHRYAR